MAIFRSLQFWVEGFFAFSLVTNFFIEHHYHCSDKVERNILKLAEIYAKGRFFFDLVALVPFVSIFGERLDQRYLKLFYLLKISRMHYAIQQIDNKILMRDLKRFLAKRIEEAKSKGQQKFEFGEADEITEAQEIGNQQENHITMAAYVGYLVKLF